MRMEEYREVNQDGHKGEPAPMGANRWFVGAIVALLVVAGVAFGYGYRQQILASHLAAQEAVASATISQMHGQLSTLTAKLNDMTAAQAAASAAAQNASQPKKKSNAASRSAAKRGAPVDKRYKQLQAQLQEQQKQLKETQDLVAKNRTDIEGNLNSTRDDLNGSIARMHEELVVLAKRGERSYFEFDLTRSKQFQRVGPMDLSLRRVDAKHKNYDLQMVVDDNQLTKKRVNLYEPVWIHTESESQPVQVVVNRIEKNGVHGYISAPKYKNSELVPALTQVSAPAGSSPNTDSSSTPPKQPE